MILIRRRSIGLSEERDQVTSYSTAAVPLRFVDGSKVEIQENPQVPGVFGVWLRMLGDENRIRTCDEGLGQSRFVSVTWLDFPKKADAEVAQAALKLAVERCPARP